jgi:hypothetical protein
MSENPPLVESALDAYDAVRTINHLARGAIPAPVAYDVLGNLKCLCYMLPQTFHQIGQGLIASLTEYDVYDDDCCYPAMNVTLARSYLLEAAQKAAEVGRLLESAQSAISRQGYRVRAPEGPTH